jgi:hypothetical protein
METDPSLRLRVTPAGSRMRDHAVMLSPFVALRVNSAKHLEAQRERPFAAAQGDIVRHLRLMLIGCNSLRPLHAFERFSESFVNDHHLAATIGRVRGRGDCPGGFVFLGIPGGLFLRL